MTVTSVVKDVEALTMTVTAELAASAERAWQLWEDPRQLERWWGPPTYPATVVAHDLRPGGRVTYYMTGPEGDQPRGLWDVREAAAPRRLVIEDAFADEAWEPAAGMPRTIMEVDIADRAGSGVLMTMVSRFPSAEALQQMVEMGMEEGLREALAQIDAVLADSPAA